MWYFADFMFCAGQMDISFTLKEKPVIILKKPITRQPFANFRESMPERELKP